MLNIWKKVLTRENPSCTLRQKTEDRRQKTEDRRQKTEDRRQKTEVDIVSTSMIRD